MCLYEIDVKVCAPGIKTLADAIVSLGSDGKKLKLDLHVHPSYRDIYPQLSPLEVVGCV